MVAVVGSIAAELLLDRSKFDQGLGRAGITAKKFEGDTRASLGRVDRNFSSTFTRIGTGGAVAFASMAKGAALALAPILSVSAALGTAKAALDQFSAVADNAKSSGLDAETFQALAYQAEQSGVAFETFSKGLETFEKSAGLAEVGKGRMLTALKALNPELLANIQAATTQEERVRLAADAIAAAGSASEKAALSTALFGDAGAKLADAFAGGAAQIDAMTAKARELGLVVDRDLIARSEELGDELSTATQIMDLEFKKALVDLAPILVSTAQLAGNLAAAINYMTESMQGLEARSTARLEQDYQGLMSTLDQANATYAPGVVGNMGVQIDPDKQAAMQAEADAMRAELRRRAVQKLAVDLNKPKFEPFDPDDIGGGTSTRNAAADAAIKQAESVQNLIASLKHEQDQLGRTAEEQEYFNLLKQAGVSADSEFGQAIADTLGPLQAQRSALEANKAAMEEIQSLAGDTLKGFLSDLRQGSSLTDALSNAFGKLADKLLDMAIDGPVTSHFTQIYGEAA